jgi:hypothetical protein
MAQIRFAQQGDGIDVLVAPNIKSAKVTITFNWDDDPSEGGQAITEVVLDGDGKTIKLRTNGDERPSGGAISDSTTLSGVTSGEKKYNLQLSGVKRLVNFSDTRLDYNDSQGNNDINATISISSSNIVYYEAGETSPPPIDPEGETPVSPPPPQSCPGPTPWSPAVPSSCPAVPSPNEINTGLSIKKEGDSTVVLNLKNFAGKLVTLKLTHQTSASWTQTFSYSITKCSDISPDPGGSPYSKSTYSNSAIVGTNEFVFYNIDGGDYDYTFTHGFILPASKPTRTIYTLVCSGDPPSCSCVSSIETYSGPWPPCKPEVGILNSGGNIVRWQYHDGNGSFTAQQMTLEVVSVKNIVPNEGAICTSTLKSNAWIPDPLNSAVNGNCLSNYLNHSEKIRFRVPATSSSKTSLTSPICFSNFRGVAGATPPTSPGGSSSNQYSILHVYDETFKKQLDFTISNGIAVTVENASDTYVSPYEEVDPSLNSNLGTSSRRHYTVQLSDGTVVDDTVSNVDIVVPQPVTAGGLGVNSIVTFKKTKVSSNTFKVWFYTSFKNQEDFTNDPYHVFDEDLNQTDSGESILVFPEMTVVPQNPTEPGNLDPSYSILDASNKKHYLITFLDSTTVDDAEASNILIYDRNRLTASGETQYIFVSKKQKVDDKSLRVWFRSFYQDRPDGSKYDNAFIRGWAVSRGRDVNYSGNVFPRTWYVNPKL